MAEVKGIKIQCPKCNRELLRLSYTGILMAPKTLFVIICGGCGVGVNLPDAFPGLFHITTPEELLPTTIPYLINTQKSETNKGEN